VLTAKIRSRERLRTRSVWLFAPWTLAEILCAIICAVVAARGDVVPYDIVYVRQPRFGDTINTTWPEVAHPAKIDPGADLMLLHPDGSEELLVAGGVGAVTDPFVSFDAQWVYYAYFHDARPQAINSQRDLPRLGADLFRIHLQTRAIEQLTFGEFTPNTGAGNFDEANPLNPSAGHDYLGYGILNLGPAPLAGGKIVFTSNRNGFMPPRGLTRPTMQLFVMDDDGRNVTQIAPMNIGSALHPTPLRDGRLMFSTMETQGLRDTRVWGIWSIYPDGRHWEPVVSAFRGAQAFHFMTQLSDEDIVVTDYYNLNNNGFGALYRLPIAPPPGEPRFHSAFPAQNPAIQQTVGGGFLYPFRMPFTPRGMYSITPFTHGNDEAAPIGPSGARVGKLTHPSAAPGNDLLVVWTPGPANDLNRPTTDPRYDAGLYLIPGGAIVSAATELVPIKNDPAYNEAWPRAVVPYSAVHGVAEPLVMPWLPNDGSVHPALPAGTPYGLVGTSSFYKRESFPGYVVPWSNTFDGLDVFNTTENDQSSNWSYQGADAGRYANSDIWAVRIVAMEPSTHRSYGPHGGPSGGQLFSSHASERLRILGEIPLRKLDADGAPLLDAEGNPDTSFLARIPADTPFTFQTIDRDGRLLNAAQTWHQVRPGEMRADCGGCHAHSQQPLAFASTYAARPEYEVVDLVHETPLLTRDSAGDPAVRVENSGVVDVEFYRDIRPLLVRSCVPCHTQNDPDPPGDLVLDDYAFYGNFPGDYARLAADANARWGYPPLVRVGGNPVWRQTNTSRYIRAFQSRRSLLVWKIFGARSDGWSNADHPTESVPGDAATLPSGESINESDLDFSGEMMPPPLSGVPALSADEKMTIARWIDLGAPINWGAGGTTPWGWFLDDLRPTLTLSAPRPGRNTAPLAEIRLGVADANSGVDPNSLSIHADFEVAGRAPGNELADLAEAIDDGIYRIAVQPPLTAATNAFVHAEVADYQGNVTRVERSFSVQGATPSATPSAVAPTPTRSASAATNTPTATIGATATPRRFTISGRLRTAGGAPLAAATVTLSGARPATGASDASGDYSFAALAAGAWTIRPTMLGATGGAITALDAAWVLQATVGARTFDMRQALAADVTGNGSVSPLDASHILQMRVGALPRFAVAAACASDWFFLPNAAPAPGQTNSPPRIAGGTCVPGQIAFADLSSDAAGQSFDATPFGDCTGNWTPPAALSSAAAPAVVLGNGRDTRRRFARLPIWLRGAAANAAELQLQYDPRQLRLRRVRTAGGARGAALAYAEPAAGSVHLALASAHALASDRRPILTVVFEKLSRQDPRAVRITRATIDDQAATIAP
jgi:hypothetical protein